MSTHVALLRAINLGAVNKLPMKDLVGLFEGAGATNVRTYIQSGNVVFDAAAPDAVSAKVGRAIEKKFGFTVPIITRTRAELAKVPKANPFLARGAEKCHVAFLKDKPAQGSALDPDRSPGDETAIIGRDIYLFLPNGVGRSKLTNDYFDRRLSTISTMRNWRTVLKLIEMLGA